MVLHMPVGYTALFAEKLNEISELEVREARDGDRLQPGVALLAPAGRHLSASAARRLEVSSPTFPSSRSTATTVPRWT
jgi:chemotaxis response regulator CheB